MFRKVVNCWKAEIQMPIIGEDCRVGPFVGKCVDIDDDGGEFVNILIEVDACPRCCDCILCDADGSTPSSYSDLSICNACENHEFYWPKKGVDMYVRT